MTRRPAPRLTQRRTQRRCRPLLALPLVLALATTAFAQDPAPDAESRFHRAYEAEVVDGKLADAARVYLSIAGDETAPARIRAESRFRFAVTAVLLGRADEARSLLAGLADDGSAPESLRKRANEYLDAVQGIGLGTELDRKLQSLVFELGRAPDDANATTVYRDFEVIGAPAVPFLRGLLGHQDEAIRRHAYRILLRMQADGMGAAWTPSFTLRDGGTGDAAAVDLSDYLRNRPDERAAWERRLLSESDDLLVRSIENPMLYVRASADLLRAAAARGARARGIAGLLRSSVREDEAVRALCREWMRDPAAPLAHDAAWSWLWAAAERPPAADDEALALLTDVTRSLTAAPRDLGWTVRRRRDGIENRTDIATATSDAYVALARRCPLDALLDLLASLVPPDTSDAASVQAFATGPFDALACAIEDLRPEGADLARFADVVSRAAEWCGTRGIRAADGRHGVALTAHLADTVVRLPRDAATERLARLLAARETSVREYGVNAIGRRSAAGWELAAALLPSSVPQAASSLLEAQGWFQSAGPAGADADRRRALAASVPMLVRLSASLEERQRKALAKAFGRFVAGLPTDEARTAFAAALTAFREAGDGEGRSVFFQVIESDWAASTHAAFWRLAFLPEAAALYPLLDADERGRVLVLAAHALDVPGAADFVVAHAEDVPPSAIDELAARPDLAPFEAWVPRVTPSSISALRGEELPADRVTAALAKMAPDPANVNESVIAFAWENGAAGAPLLERVLREAPPARVAIVMEYVSRGDAISHEAILAGLDRLVQSGGDVTAIRRATVVLSQDAPSPRLFPAVRHVLANGAKQDVVLAIQTAQSLGSAELLPALTSQLDSLDADVRAAAQTAIAKIEELESMRKAARLRAAGFPVPDGK